MSLTAHAPEPAALDSRPIEKDQGRVLSIDALRGFDMFWIIGADALFQAFDKISGGNPLLRGIASQLDHVPWEGFHFYDLIFPLFVFIVGVSIVFSLSKRVSQEGRAAALRQVFRRFVILYLLGLFAYGGIEKGVEQIRLLGVLQRIALCYLFGALAFLHLNTRQMIALCAGLLLGYWALMTFVPVPGIGAGNFAEGKNLANYIDSQYLPFRKWDGDHDPEGLLSTLPAIGNCLLGIFAGLLLRNGAVSSARKVCLLCAWGAAGAGLGFLWGVQFPIVKKIWTSSFALAAGGFSSILLGLFYYLIDARGWRAWAKPFVWIGTNAITIYMLVHVVELTDLAKRLVGGEILAGFDSIRPGAGGLLVALVALSLAVGFCRFLYQRKIFLKV